MADYGWTGVKKKTIFKYCRKSLQLAVAKMRDYFITNQGQPYR